MTWIPEWVEWATIPTTTAGNPVQSLLRRVEAVTAAKKEQLSINTHGFLKGSSMVVSTTFCLYRVVKILLKSSRSRQINDGEANWHCNNGEEAEKQGCSIGDKGTWGIWPLRVIKKQ